MARMSSTQKRYRRWSRQSARNAEQWLKKCRDWERTDDLFVIAQQGAVDNAVWAWRWAQMSQKEAAGWPAVWP